MLTSPLLHPEILILGEGTLLTTVTHLGNPRRLCGYWLAAFLLPLFPAALKPGPLPRYTQVFKCHCLLRTPLLPGFQCWRRVWVRVGEPLGHGRLRWRGAHLAGLLPYRGFSAAEEGPGPSLR